MARPLRIEYPGAIYHIIARGNEQKEIFRGKFDREKFKQILQHAKEKYDLIYYAYTLMNNHYHLILETLNANLVKTMHEIQTRYTIYFNKKYNRVGHLFQGRYKAILVDKQNYLLELSRYIHLNPVRAGYVEKPEEFEWSSYLAYIGIKNDNLVDTEWILNQFSLERNISYKKYKEFVEDRTNQRNIKKDIYGQIILGSKEFTQTVKEKIGNMKISSEVPEREKIKKRKSIARIFDILIEYYGKTKKEITNPNTEFKEIRKLAIFLINEFTDSSLQEIGNLFGNVHYTTINKLIKKFKLVLENRADLREQIEKIKTKICS